MRMIKATLLASVLAAVSLTSGVDESLAGVATAGAVAAAAATVAQGSQAEQVYWHGGYGWRRPYYGWGGGYYYGGGCWRWRATPWGPRRVWVC